MVEGLKDVKPPVDFPSYLWIGMIVLLVLLLVMIIWLIDKKMKKNKIQIQMPAPNPWDVAYYQLNQLNNENLIHHGKYQEYFFRLSDILRYYIEGRFTLKAPEMTTEEFLICLEASFQLLPEQKQGIKDFLTQSDLVKFAKFKPSSEQADKGFNLVKKFVDETKVVKAVVE